jgi:hypothetical protein
MADGVFVDRPSPGRETLSRRYESAFLTYLFFQLFPVQNKTLTFAPHFFLVEQKNIFLWKCFIIGLNQKKMQKIFEKCTPTPRFWMSAIADIALQRNQNFFYIFNKKYLNLFLMEFCITISYFFIKNSIRPLQGRTGHSNNATFR